jgi:hypothetical protein
MKPTMNGCVLALMLCLVVAVAETAGSAHRRLMENNKCDQCQSCQCGGNCDCMGASTSPSVEAATGERRWRLSMPRLHLLCVQPNPHVDVRCRPSINVPALCHSLRLQTSVPSANRANVMATVIAWTPAPLLLSQ